jgi:imidazolonepropionase
LSEITLLTGLRQVATCQTPDESSVRQGQAIAIRGGRVLAIAKEVELRARFASADIVDCGLGVITPGFVDSHTHAVFGAWRASEYALRCRGVPYMEIARRGGGILASVRDVRARSEDELVELARPRLREMLESGTTTAEVKSGYGLETEAELKMLRVVRRLAEEGPVDLVPTFMGAHEVAPEYRANPDAYVGQVVREMIPAVAAEGLAAFCDAFMEPGVFDAAQTRRVLEAGIRHGLVPKLHADEFEGSGGAELAASLGAASADHLGAISAEGIQALSETRTVATLLPTTLMFLGKRNYAPARELLDAGAIVALATDFNPGTSPSTNMALVLTLACSQMGMHPLEALQAATFGGARALRLTDGRGKVVEGGPADLVLWDVQDAAEIPYHFGRPRVRAVWKRGTRVC